jgi:hypothetical protein
MRRLAEYIHLKPDWPSFCWGSEKLLTLLAEVRNRQGRNVEKMSAPGFELKNQADLHRMF